MLQDVETGMRRRTFVLLCVPACSRLAIGDARSSQRPRVSWLEPNTAKPSGLIAAYGEHLGQKSIGELWLRNEGCRAMTKIIEQKENVIKFRIPALMPSGWYAVSLYSAARQLVASDAVKLFVK
jgi:hypothetical protein